MSVQNRLVSIALALAAVFAATTAWAGPADDEFAKAVAQGPLIAGLATFGAGLLVSLTPCVYPMVAITVSVFGARESKSRLQGAALSAAFVAGIVTMFVPLGVFAGLTGSMFGAVLSSMPVIIGLSAVFLILAASMFGAFDMTLPDSLNNKLATMGGAGYKGAFVLGLVCGPIAAPCSGPFMTGLLTWIAQTQSAGIGAGAMAIFALGLGAPFFIVGAFAVQLPKSGRWMMHVKSFMGVVLIIVALYFLNTKFPILGSLAQTGTTFLLAMIGLVVLGLLLGALHKAFEEPGIAPKVRKGLGVAFMAGGGFLAVTGAIKPERTLEWQKITVAEAKAKAKAESRPLMVDFTAAWCGACKELDKLTFAEPRVANEAGRFVAVKVDATDDEDPKVVAAMEDLKVRGLPTVVVFDSEGKEAVRYTDFVKADEFLAAIEKVD